MDLGRTGHLEAGYDPVEMIPFWCLDFYLDLSLMLCHCAVYTCAFGMCNAINKLVTY